MDFLKTLLARRFAWFNFPSALLVALLQRTPALRWVAGAGETVLAAPAGALLKSSLAAVASLGAIDALAGATTYTVQTTNNTPNPYTVATGTNVAVAFVVTSNVGTQPVIGSWVLSSPLPPGMQFGSNSPTGYALTAATTANAATTPVFINITTPVLFGAPTTPGTYSINLLAANGNNGSAGAYPTYAFTFTMIVTGAALTPPTFSQQPLSLNVAGGGTVVLNALAKGSPNPSYQWYVNSAAIGGANAARLVLSAVSSASAGNYTCVATNSYGSATSSAAAVSVVSSSNPGRLINLSVLTAVPGSLTVGFVIGGAGTSGSENLLIRGIGPALSAFKVSNLLPDPVIKVVPAGASAPIASNSGWGTPSSNQALVQAADSATGAFALADPTSLDSALVISLPAGGDTVQLSGKTGDSGTALAEVYDYTTGYTLASPRLINLSCLDQVSAGGVLTAGFVVSGATAKTLLIRATGPALTTFGVGGVMPDPQVALQASSATAPLASNAGWGGDAAITNADNAVGAFALKVPTSLDSAILITVPPGAYTAQVTSVSGVGGSALVEVYEVP